ncbi:hypothetical protein SERLA73DRAFT_75730 [Serpula lacrymans var. lacrymans S7.3]|uniref:C2 domain-containing protein n=2 Tax=Serpula lacrymans var. lacrymans TaxID=341189 RepID=F8Q425_SERL3|nr:uncharacterized protein SERLADRAFT_440502 [Serpula lacrymans var. lacrymans S7.9]EGN96881.1 hypothetical protein SERLA73DRAFT_75730 [Serpula lacrymans var. lacrymans S7.3]EGO22481.1 hypothetical protein SERLADRAFT_440502 [Serpula lacrymans var. lacrymans S7.9]
MKTKTSKGISPGWNESFEFEVQTSSPIKLAVIRTPLFRPNVLIGEASLCLKDTLKDKHSFEDTYQLCKDGSRTAKSGSIVVRLELVEDVSGPVFQSQDLALSHELKAPVTTSNEPSGREAARNSSNSTKPEVLHATESAVKSANKPAHDQGASNAGMITSGVDNLESLSGTKCFDSVCGYVEKLTNIVDVVSEIHPYAKAAWSILGLIPKAGSIHLDAQLNRDQKIQGLWSTASDMLDFLDAAEPVIDEIQRPIVSNMLKQIHDCALFIQEYAGSGFCKRALRDTSSSESGEAISQYVAAFQQLKEQFKIRSSLSKLKVFREVREGLVEVGEALQNIKEMDQHQMIQGLLGDIRTVMECDENQACLANTRVSLLDEIMEWVDDPRRPQYFWLHGPAGSGKSTVANTIVGRCKNLGRLGASFSFKRDISGRNIPDFMIGNLAYQLAFFSTHFRQLLWSAICTSGNINLQPLHAQLQKYIIAPMKGLSFSGPVVIVIDALDECGDESTREAFLNAWSQGLPHLPSFVKVLFVSRYEDDIRVQLESTPTNLSKSIGGTEGTQQDIMAYIENQMREVHRRHPYLRSRPDWPSQDEKDKLQHRADDPIVGLDDMLSGERWFPGKPENTTDRLYLDILRRKLNDLPAAEGLNYFQYIMGSVVVAKTPLTCAQLDSLLGLCPATAKDPLKLPDGSVIKISTSSGLVSSLSSMLRAEGDTVRLLHASLADFFTDRGRCTDTRFFVDASVHNRILAFRCLETLQRTLKRDPCGIADATKDNSEVDDLDGRLKKFLSPDGWYAFEYWHEHLSGIIENSDGLYDQARSFLFSHLLHLIEVKSLQGAIDSTFHVLSAEVSKSPPDNVIPLLNDAVRFLQQFREPVTQHAAHIYLSGIPFIAQNTTLYKTFAPELRAVPKLCSSPAQSLKLITLPMSYDRCAAISPDCTRLASVSRYGTIQIWDVESCTPIRDLTDGALICAGDMRGYIYVWDANTSEAKGGPFSRSGTGGPVRRVSFVNRWTVIASYGDEIVCVWDIESGRVLVEWQGNCGNTQLRGPFVIANRNYDEEGLRVFQVKSNPVTIEEYVSNQVIRRVQVSLDEQRVAFLLGPDSNPVIRIIKSSGDTVSSWPLIADKESRISFTDSGAQLLVWAPSTEPSHVRFYDADSGSLVRDVVMSDMAELVRVTADESRLLTWNTSIFTIVIKIFDLANGHQIASLGHYRILGDVRYCILPSGNRLVAIGSDDVTIWDPVLLESESRPSRHATSLILSPTSRQFAAAFSDNIVELSNLDGNPLSCTVLPGARSPFAFAPSGKQLVCASLNNDLLCFNLAEETSVKPAYLGHSGLITSLAFSADGITASQDSTIRIWDVRSESELCSLPCNSSGVVRLLALSSDKSRVTYQVASDYHGPFQTLDAASGHIIGYVGYRPYRDLQHWASFSPEGKHVVCVSTNGHSCLRDGHTGQYLRHIDLQPQVTDAAFARNASPFVTISELDIVDIRHTAPTNTNPVRQILKNSLGTITILCLSFAGKYILIGTEGGYVSMSDTTQGVLIWEASGYRDIWNMAFSSHGEKVAAIVGGSDSPSRQVNLLEGSIGKLMSSCRASVDQNSISVEFSPDETQLIGTTQTHKVTSIIEVDDTI